MINSNLNDTAIKTENLSENAYIYWGQCIELLSMGCIGEFIIFLEQLTNSQVYKIEEYLSKNGMFHLFKSDSLYKKYKAKKL